MKKSNVRTDFAIDKVNFLNQNLDPTLTSSGHYAVPISRTEKLLANMDSTDDSEKVFLTKNNLSSKSSDEKKKIAKKLHCQFGHSSSEKLKKLLQSANIHDKELIEEINNIEEQCDICLQYKKPKLRPVVGFSLSKDFNDVVAVDVKAMEMGHILHIVEHATRFSAEAVVKSKHKEEMAEDQQMNIPSLFRLKNTRV